MWEDPRNPPFWPLFVSVIAEIITFFSQNRRKSPHVAVVIASARFLCWESDDFDSSTPFCKQCTLWRDEPWRANQTYSDESHTHRSRKETHLDASTWLKHIIQNLLVNKPGWTDSINSVVNKTLFQIKHLQTGDAHPIPVRCQLLASLGRHLGLHNQFTQCFACMHVCMYASCMGMQHATKSTTLLTQHMPL